jgi:hypothetical protein
MAYLWGRSRRINLASSFLFPVSDQNWKGRKILSEEEGCVIDAGFLKFSYLKEHLQ